MKTRITNAFALFFAGFFVKDAIDDIFFLMIDKYPLDFFAFQITAASQSNVGSINCVNTDICLLWDSQK